MDNQFGTPDTWRKTFPQGLRSQYPGLGGFSDALRGYGNLAYGPASEGYASLTGAAASDPIGAGFEGATPSLGGSASGGRGLNAALGLYGQLYGGIGGANVAGAKARDVGQNAAMKGITDTGIGAADLMAGQQRANTQLASAQNTLAGDELGLFTQLLKFGASPLTPGGQSPIGMGVGGLGNLGSGLMDKFPGIGSLISNPAGPFAMGMGGAAAGGAAAGGLGLGALMGSSAAAGAGGAGAEIMTLLPMLALA